MVISKLLVSIFAPPLRTLAVERPVIQVALESPAWSTPPLKLKVLVDPATVVTLRPRARVPPSRLTTPVEVALAPILKTPLPAFTVTSPVPLTVKTPVPPAPCPTLKTLVAAVFTTPADTFSVPTPVLPIPQPLLA